MKCIKLNKFIKQYVKTTNKKIQLNKLMNQINVVNLIHMYESLS